MSHTLNGEPVDLDAFFADNYLDVIEIAALLSLQPGESYAGGGGAWAEWVICRVA